MGCRPAPRAHATRSPASRGELPWRGAAAFGGLRMVIGLLLLALAIPGAKSLKDKRRAIKGLKDRLGGRHNVSVAEVGDLDEHRRCRLAVAMVSNDRRFTDSCLSKIVDEVRRQRSLILVDYELEFY